MVLNISSSVTKELKLKVRKFANFITSRSYRRETGAGDLFVPLLHNRTKVNGVIDLYYIVTCPSSFISQ